MAILEDSIVAVEDLRQLEIRIKRCSEDRDVESKFQLCLCFCTRTVSVSLPVRYVAFRSMSQFIAAPPPLPHTHPLIL